MSHSGGQDGGDPTGPVGRVQSRRIGATQEISAPEGGSAAAGVDGAEGVAGAEASAGAREIDPAGEVGKTEAAGGVTSTDAVAEALQAGRIDADSARAALIEQAIAAHLPTDADPAVVAELRAELTAALADDPTLGSLLG